MAEEQKPPAEKPQAASVPPAAGAAATPAAERKGKKKTKKNIQTGIVYIQSTFNNTIITIADVSGNVISWSSAGARGFKGSRKSTPFAAQVAEIGRASCRERGWSSVGAGASKKKRE